jgi:hypothetical protein
LTKLNRLCGVKNNVFSEEKMPRCKNSVIVFEIYQNEKEPFEDGEGAQFTSLGR